MTYPAPKLTLCKSGRIFERDNRTDLKNAGHIDVRWEFSSPVFRILNHREAGMFHRQQTLMSKTGPMS